MLQSTNPKKLSNEGQGKIHEYHSEVDRWRELGERGGKEGYWDGAQVQKEGGKGLGERREISSGHLWD